MKKLKAKHKKLKIFTIAALLLIIIMGAAFFLWASDYYHAEETALAVMENDAAILIKDNLTVLAPSYPTDTAFIFYPGAKVEAIAYLPLLEKIKEATGMACILVEMPLNMAIFDSDAADKIIEAYPEYETWYIGGHSMGGAMASDYASKNPDKVKGLILMGAYIYGDYPAQKALTIYGTFNANLEENINYTENIVIIDGGNHAQFGNYGRQKGDPDATITAEEQQKQTVEAIVKFISMLQ